MGVAREVPHYAQLRVLVRSYMADASLPGLHHAPLNVNTSARNVRRVPRGSRFILWIVENYKAGSSP